MGFKPVVGRIVFNSVLTAYVVASVFVSGCVPPKNKAPQSEAVTSAPTVSTTSSEPAAPAPAAAAAGDDLLSHIWQRLVSLENQSGNIGFISIGNVVVEKSQTGPLARNVRRIEVGMDVLGQLRKPFVEAMIHIDASPARIAGVDTSDVSDVKPEEVIVTAFLSKGRAGWRMQPADGQVPLVSQRLRLFIDAPHGMESVELRIQRSFKKANGDLFNNKAPMPDSSEAQRLLGAIQKERSRRAEGKGSDVFWAGVGDCASIKGEQKNGQCYPTDASWRLAEKRAAGLGATPYQEKVTLSVSGGAAMRMKEEPAQAAKPVEVPKPVEVAQPEEAPKPVEAAQPEEAPKPVEVAQPVEAPKPVEAAQPVEAPKPVETAKPEEAPMPVKTPKAKQEPAKKPAIKKEAAKPKAETGQPIYDLSDVLGKK